VTTLDATAASEVAVRRRTDPRRLVKELRGDLDWITLEALKKDRARRYQSAYGLGLDIRRHLRDEPVTVGPPGLAHRLGMTARRHKLASVVALAVVLIILIGLIASTVLD
jgi:hypothetical protein